jgi:hypothetical protein
MFEAPEMLSALAGAIAGWLVAGFLFRASCLRRILLGLCTVAVLVVLAMGGIHALESTLVGILAAFFATSYFAFGAIVGGVMAAGGKEGSRGGRRAGPGVDRQHIR